MQEYPYPIIPAVKVQVDAGAPLLKGIEVINSNDARIALVIDKNSRMVGSLVDGDVRRALLKGYRLESPVREAMHENPYVMSAESTRQQLIAAMQSVQVKQIPLLAVDGTLVGIAVFDVLAGMMRTPRTNAVIIMAGGKGRRLLPITQDIPKPMVEVGGKPMLEHILLQFIRQGFSRFHIALNHLGHVIEEHFGDGKAWGCRISYIREPEALGTAGALSLLEEKMAEPFIVSNGDILTSADFCALLDYHAGTGSMATVAARAHRMEVPYGVIQIKDGMMQAIAEKPVYEDLISAGMYCLSPEALRYVPKGQAIDMPSVLQNLVANKHKVAVFPIGEDWVDVGRYDDLERAKIAFAKKVS